MVRVRVILLQGELKFSPKVYPHNIQTFNLNSNGDWELKDKSMECKCLGKLFESEDDAFRSVRNIIAATLATMKMHSKSVGSLFEKMIRRLLMNTLNTSLLSKGPPRAPRLAKERILKPAEKQLSRATGDQTSIAPRAKNMQRVYFTI